MRLARSPSVWNFLLPPVLLSTLLPLLLNSERIGLSGLDGVRLPARDWVLEGKSSVAAEPASTRAGSSPRLKASGRSLSGD